MKRLLFVTCALLFAPLATAGNLTGAFTGTVTGLVENQQGAMVSPRATVEASTLVTTDAEGRATGATVSGTVACANGLGLTILFAATYDTVSGILSGSFSDIPGSATLNKSITFTKTGDLTWTGQMSGDAPSATGKRAYDLQVEITLPIEALFVGTEFPAARSYKGQLNDTITVQVPVSIPLLGYNQTHSVTLSLAGEWTAKDVPLPNGGGAVTGNVSGSFVSQAPVYLELTIPGKGTLPVSVGLSGAFAGTLISNSATEVAFIGAWTASAGDPTFGGDLLITVPINDLPNLKAIPYSYVGVLSVDPGIVGAPAISIPLNISGSFPFAMQ
jgi:hypothetical protein